VGNGPGCSQCHSGKETRIWISQSPAWKLIWGTWKEAVGNRGRAEDVNRLRIHENFISANKFAVTLQMKYLESCGEHWLSAPVRTHQVFILVMNFHQSKKEPPVADGGEYKVLPWSLKRVKKHYWWEFSTLNPYIKYNLQSFKKTIRLFGRGQERFRWPKQMTLII